MLRPTKHSHPDRTVINVALLMLKLLKTQRLASYDVLLKYAKKAVIGGDVLFRPSLSVLFLLGVVKYHQKNDALEYVESHETL